MPTPIYTGPVDFGLTNSLHLMYRAVEICNRIIFRHAFSLCFIIIFLICVSIRIYKIYGSGSQQPQSNMGTLKKKFEFV